MEVVICSSCSTNLSERIPLYDALWKLIEVRSRNALNALTVENIAQVDRVIEAGPLLDLLQIPNECCRMEMLGKTRASQLGGLLETKGV